MVRAPEEGVAPDGRRFVHAETRAALRGWLDEHQDDGAGAWLVSWKKATGRPVVVYNDLVEELLCVGWVDSTAGSLDAERGMLWCAPRKKGSGWAATNKTPTRWRGRRSTASRRRPASSCSRGS